MIVIKTISTLDIRRHFYKSPTKDVQGRTRIDPDKSYELAEKVAAAALPQTTSLLFHGVEPRTLDTLVMIETVWGPKGTTRFSIDEIGGDEWTLKYAFTKELQAELKENGRKDYLRFLIEKLGRDRVIAMALYAVSGINKMFNIINIGHQTHGLAIGHSPDMLMFVAWALSGFPEDVTTMDHGDGNLPEGEGYRIGLMEDGTLRLVEHLSL